MRLATAIGTIVCESEWAPLLHFLEARQSPLPALEDREVVVRVTQEDRSSIAILGDDLPDAYPRRVYIEGCEFIVSKDRIEGRVPKDLVQVGLVIEFLWYCCAVCCAPEGWEAVHASAVESNKGACLIFGDCGAGKTRTAIDMMQNGWRYLSDDIVLVNAEGTQARGWDSTLHVDPRAAKAMGYDSLTLDFCGKIRVPPPAKAVRRQAPIVQLLTAGGSPATAHIGPAFGSTWVNNYGVGEKLLAAAKPVASNTLDIRVAFTNRNPASAATPWYGGDMIHLLGYMGGVRALGAQADFVPYDELDESKYDLIHLFHTQFEWSRQVAETTTKPLVVSAITQGSPEVADVMPAVRRARAVLCYSPLEEEWYASRFPQYPREMFVSVPLGVPAEIYQQSEPVTPTFSVFMAGRYSSIKNQLAVLQACKQLDVPVVFAGMMDAGSGEYLRTLRQEAGDWRGARFLGTLKGEALWRRYRAAHVHAQPSTWEAFGLCTWEALACGCNCVVTNNGWGGPAFESHATVCDPDPEAVRVAIQQELRLPRNRHNFHPPTWQQASRALVPIYREALA